jgi:hypothetical protein
MTTGVGSPADRLETLPPGVPAYTLGWEVVAWASKYLRHPNGPRSGQRWKFIDSQVRFLLWFYALNGDGHWLYHHAVRRLAKGSGKSPFAALIALAELTAPVRLDDWDPRAPGGVRGKPVSMPLVQVAATNEAQTTNTMRMVRAMAPKGSRIVADYQLDPGKTKYYREPEGTLEVITASAAGAEGAEATCVIGDETEHWIPSRGGPELAATLEDNLTKSGNRMLQTCNSWTPGLGSVAEESWEAWCAQEEGRTRGESRILYDARVAPPDTDLADPESLRRGLEAAYGDCWWVDLRAIMERVWDPRSQPDDSRRKYLNQPTASDDAWTTPQAWARLADPTRVVTDREDVALFFDGSKSRDASALVGCCLSDGHVFTVEVWEPDPRYSVEDQVDAAEVDLAIARAFERYNVVAFFSDVREWESFAKVSWPAAYADRLTVHAVPGGKDPQPIAWDMRGHVKEFTLSAELTLGEIDEGKLTHDGDSRLARHVANCRRKHNQYGITVRKESRDSSRKIDAAVAMIGARHVRRLALAAAPKRKRSGRVY